MVVKWRIQMRRKHFPEEWDLSKLYSVPTRFTLFLVRQAVRCCTLRFGSHGLHEIVDTMWQRGAIFFFFDFFMLSWTEGVMLAQWFCLWCRDG